MTRAAVRKALVLCLFGTIVSAQGTPTERREGRVSGSVVDYDVAKSPIAGALVTAVRISDKSPDQPIYARSDQLGMFNLGLLAPGRYRLDVRKPGFIVAGAEGRGAAAAGSGTVINVLPGVHIENIQISMTRGGIISGLVIDLDGSPAPGVFVGLTPEAGDGSGVTDAEGRYRIYGLPRGTYRVWAMPDRPLLSSGRVGLPADVEASLAAIDRGQYLGAREEFMLSRTFFPGVSSDSHAAEIVVGAGTEHSGVDFPLVLAGSRTVSGVILGEDGGGLEGANIQLIAESATRAGQNTMSRVGGVFGLDGVPPGRYFVVATCKRQRGALRDASGHLRAETAIDLSGGDVREIALQLIGVGNITGRLKSEEGVDIAAAEVRMVRQDGPVRVASVDSDGEFRIEGVSPGRYRVDLAGVLTVHAVYLRQRRLREPIIDVQPGTDLTEVDIVVGRR